MDLPEPRPALKLNPAGGVVWSQWVDGSGDIYTAATVGTPTYLVVAKLSAGRHADANLRRDSKPRWRR